MGREKGEGGKWIDKLERVGDGGGNWGHHEGRMDGEWVEEEERPTGDELRGRSN